MFLRFGWLWPVFLKFGLAAVTACGLGVYCLIELYWIVIVINLIFLFFGYYFIK